MTLKLVMILTLLLQCGWKVRPDSSGISHAMSPSICYAVTVPLTIATLTLFKYRQQGCTELLRFRLISMVSAKWRLFGKLLHFHENELEAFDLDYRGPGGTTKCWCKVMDEWMKRVERSWEKVHDLLKRAECAKVARDLKRALLCAVAPPRPTTAVHTARPPVIEGSEDEDSESSEDDDSHAQASTSTSAPKRCPTCEKCTIQ